ncbi:MAG: glycosyltransferase family 4 protein [DPANN group archaeon]|nr:glycosyltransferase family 4 protein [DPANN group archaeon]
MKKTILLTGSKEYPFGTNQGDDSIPSGGIEVYTTRFVKEFSKYKNINLKIITRKFKGTKSYEKKDNIEIYRVSWIRGFFLRNISFNFFSFLKYLTLDFDILFATGPFAVLFAKLTKLLKNKKLVARPAGISCSQPQYNSILRFVLKQIEILAYRNTDCIVFLSNEEKIQFTKKLGIKPQKDTIIPTGINITDYENIISAKIKDEFNLKGKTVITFIGRLIEVKGLKYLIDAVKEIKNKDIIILLVGDGPERIKLESYVKKQDLKDKIIFTGQRSDIPELLASTDIFIMPSLSEGLPASLLEAMASEIPSVVTDIGLPVENRKTALVVPSKDSKVLADAIDELIKDPKLASVIGKNAKVHIKNNFSWDYAVLRYKKLFDKLYDR